MDQQIKAKLLEINQNFYNRFSGSFSATRNQVQPGVRRLIRDIQPNARILDVGCGNGTLARALASQGFSGQYLGIDLSEGLLRSARDLMNKPRNGTYEFQWINLSDPLWASIISQQANQWLVSFAVLHHLPGDDLRLQTAQAFRKLIAPDGRVVISVWQWQNSPRLRKRVLPWSTVGLSSEDLDQGDVLLDWRAGESPGLRYVHTFNEDNLTALSVKAGFHVSETFYSDGKTGDLALYQVWRMARE